jgi:hypothetical protein
MDTTKIVTGVILFVGCGLPGLKSLISGRLTGKSYTSKYTEESLRRWARPSGAWNIALGLVAMGMFFSWGGLIPAALLMPLAVVWCVLCVIYLIMAKCVLKKKR